jgi:hypothetical protein
MATNRHLLMVADMDAAQSAALRSGLTRPRTNNLYAGWMRHDGRMENAVTLLISGAFALAGVVIGAWLGARSQQGQWLRNAKLRACVQLMDEYATLYAAIAVSRRDSTWEDLDWAPWNQALTAVSFVCPHKVVETAYAIDTAWWHASSAVRNRSVDWERWLQLRTGLEEARERFIHAVRVETYRTYTRAVPTSGRPEPDHPMWGPPDSDAKPPPPNRSPDDEGTQ